ncbi:regulatory protein, yteA family [Variovorax sp. PBL-E5]|nr:regulatory protein, yteA family [Variovorax sp. PBL-E5]
MKPLSTADRDLLAQRLQILKRQALDELRNAGPDVQGGLEANQPEIRTFADAAETQRLDDVRFTEIQIDRARLHDIEQAQQRLAHDRYGICTDCNEEIPRDRLFAQPTAIRCAACQAALERQQHR